MRCIKNLFLNYILLPKISWIFFFLIALAVIVSLYLRDEYFLKVVSAFSGMYGSALACREIIYKGIKQITHEARHIDYGDLSQTPEIKEEERQVDLNAEAGAYGELLLFVSAFFLFFCELFTRH